MQPLTQHYLKEYERMIASRSISANALHQSAIQDLIENGLPTIQNEGWRYSATSPVLKQPFKMHFLEAEPVDMGSLALHKSTQSSLRIICFNGRFHLDPAIPMPLGLEIKPILTLMEQESLSSFESFAEASNLNQGFSALNTLFAQEGLYINVRDGYEILPVIEVYYLFDRKSIATTEPFMHCTRNHITVGANSALNFIEYVGIVESNADPVLTHNANNTMTTVVLHADAKLHWAQSLTIPNDQTYLGQLAVQQHQNSLFHAESLVSGGQLVRQTLSVDLKEIGAACILKGLSKVKKKEHIDHQVVVNHQASHTKSDIHYRGIADEQGRLIFNGEVKAEVGIQKMESTQRNYNLLLSDQAEINTKPRLSLAADDIQCSHGATVGDLDSNALFYLQSRGLAWQAARLMLTRAFSEVIWGSMPLLLKANSGLLDDFLSATKQSADNLQPS